MCQLEQIKDKQTRKLMTKDYDDAWHEIQSRDHFQGTENERNTARYRWHYNQSVQDFQKLQMTDKVQRGMQIYNELNDEREQLARLSKEDFEKEQKRLRNEKALRKAIGSAVSHQIRENCQARKQNFERDLKVEQSINEQIRRDLEKSQIAEKCEKDQFRRDVFSFLDNLMVTRHHNKIVESEKEKLIEAIQEKSADDSWKSRCEAYQKRVMKNKEARMGQVQQIIRNEKLMIEQAAKEKKENEIFNERERLERLRIEESKWQKRNKAFHYGRELIDQQKSEELRNAAEKQKLNETLMLVARERERNEEMGLQFVKSYQDVLPLHPNLLIIQKGKKHH